MSAALPVNASPPGPWQTAAPTTRGLGFRLASGQQYPQHVRRGLCGALAQPFRGQAPQRVRQYDVWVLRDASQLRHRLGARYERLRADDRSGHAHLLEGDPVVHTARRTGPSVARGGYHRVAALDQLLQDVVGAGPRRVALVARDDAGELVAVGQHVDQALEGGRQIVPRIPQHRGLYGEPVQGLSRYREYLRASRRTVVGLDAKGRLVVLVSETETRGISWCELQEFLVLPESKGGLGIRDAMNLDGGSSSQLWVRGGMEVPGRPAPTYIVIAPRG